MPHIRAKSHRHTPGNPVLTGDTPRKIGMKSGHVVRVGKKRGVYLGEHEKSKGLHHVSVGGKKGLYSGGQIYRHTPGNPGRGNGMSGPGKDGVYPGKATETPAQSFTPEGMADYHHGMKSGHTNYGSSREIPRKPNSMPGSGGISGGVEKSGSVRGHASNQADLLDQGEKMVQVTHKHKEQSASWDRSAYRKTV